MHLEFILNYLFSICNYTHNDKNCNTGIHKLVIKIFIEYQFYSKFKSHTNHITFTNPIHFIASCDVVHIAMNFSKQKYVPLSLMAGLQKQFNHVSKLN
jgi:hypothetical protein